MRSFVGVSHISHSFTFKQQSILLPSPLGEGVGVRLLYGIRLSTVVRNKISASSVMMAKMAKGW